MNSRSFTHVFRDRHDRKRESRYDDRDRDYKRSRRERDL